MIREHHLKIDPKYFLDVHAGIKTFEIRFNDRNFAVNDIVCLCEYCDGKYTGRKIWCRICCLIDDPAYCKEGFVVFGIRKILYQQEKERVKDGKRL